MWANRHWKLALAAIVLAAPFLHGTATANGGGDGCRQEGLVVHEWGTFTSVSGADGVALDWRPFAGKDDLPGFVYRVGVDGRVINGLRNLSPEEIDSFNERKKERVAEIRMETPVIYFYADRETTVSVKVEFPKGEVTEWYPHARVVEGGIDWGKLTILPGADPSYPIESGESHYYPARKTDAAPVRVCSEFGNQVEKFLFYRGIGTFDLPISAELSGNEIRVRPSFRQAVSKVILFENRGGKIGFAVRNNLNAPISTQLPLPSGTQAEVERELERALISEGLFAKEAKAMIETWRDQWFEEGLRCFYLVPRPATDEILPLTIAPAPAKIVRVLVGRLEIITPEMERKILSLVEHLDDNSFDVREATSRAIEVYGRFSEPVLRRALKRATDPETRSRIEQILASQQSS
ncbi:MAG: hypothetical protein O7H41_05310 [Planctomycetota bacterium]|nr:hypothetical protein [Planctomycetota bacterium]